MPVSRSITRLATQARSWAWQRRRPAQGVRSDPARRRRVTDRQAVIGGVDGCVGQDQVGHEFECATGSALYVIPLECGVRADQRYQWYRIEGCSDTRSVLSSIT